ncbi:hypothetical protein CBM2599_B50350 [Cupriavidus taiwanensis]|nr:hypothetical protein CBM2600_B10643 [Cupriavidus taiwanensis]SOY96418.1 hypothetical protein CBM2599_B50350 [Cupriavidus taiwanensis]
MAKVEPKTPVSRRGADYRQHICTAWPRANPRLIFYRLAKVK